jgi:hypothetical protein
MQELQEMNRVNIAEVCAAFGAIGGFLNYWLKVVEGHPFSIREVAVYTATSAFSGFIAYECLDYLGFPAGVCAALCGMSGWMGTRLLRIAETMLKNKALGSPKDKE